MDRGNNLNFDYETLFKTIYARDMSQLAIADVLLGKRTVLGAMFNYEHSVDKLNTSRMFGDNYAFSIYGAHQFGYGFDGFALVGYGHQKYASRRYDVGALAFRSATSDATS